MVRHGFWLKVPPLFYRCKVNLFNRTNKLFGTAARRRQWSSVVEGADALLAVGDAKQPSIGDLVPEHVEAGRGERIVEGAAMHLLGLGERAVDIEDQGARPR